MEKTFHEKGIGGMRALTKLPGAIIGAGAAKMREIKVKHRLKNRLLRDFPEGIVGLKNLSTISKRIGSSINQNRPEDAISYAKEQKRKINAR